MSGLAKSIKNIFGACEYIFFGVQSRKEKGVGRTPWKFDTSIPSAIQNISTFLEEKNVDEFSKLLSVEIIKFSSHIQDSILHWSILTGNLKFVECICEFYKKLPNEVEDLPTWSSYINKPNVFQQTPLHWACTVQNLSIVQFLIKNGAEINPRDTKGVTPLIMCAQYGCIPAAIYLLLNGADIHAYDTEGDTALHWAFYKGNAEMARLLIHQGADPSQKDNFQQTPLHFACLSGSLTCVQDLIEKDNVKINIFDKNNKTPSMIAAGRGYYNIVSYLEYQIKSRANTLKISDKLKVSIFNQYRNTRAPFLFFIVFGLFFGNYYYMTEMRPLTIDTAPFTNSLFLLLQTMIWIFYVLTILKKPIIMKTFNDMNIDEFLVKVDLTEKCRNVNCVDKNYSFNKICWSCLSFKLPRSKHCSQCNKCILEMDHHCPYALGCVGKHNRVYFLVFLIFLNIVMLMTLYLLELVYYQSITIGFIFIFTVFLTLLGLSSGLIMIIVLLKSAIQNVSFIEKKFWKHLSYLQDDNGNYRNYYDHGIVNNLFYFFNL